MKRISYRFRKSLISHLDLPPALVMQETLLTFSGRYELTVENYRRILYYGEEHLKLSFTQGVLNIYGKSLHITYYSKEELHLAGVIEKVDFEQD